MVTFPPSRQEAVEGSSDAFLTVRPKLEQALPEVLGVGHLQGWPVLQQELDKSSVVCQYSRRPTLDLGKHSGVVVFDAEAHWRMLARLRTPVGVSARCVIEVQCA